jgi:hypothetical protein
MHKNKLTCFLIILLAFLNVLGLVSCESPVEQGTSTPTEVLQETDPVKTPTRQDTPEEVLVPSRVLLIPSVESDPDLIIRTQDALEALLKDSNWRLETHELITQELFTQDVRAVIGLGADVDIAGFAPTYQEVDFIAINNPNAIPASNISVIGDPADDSKRLAFLAGYLSALISTDYKVGALIAEDSANKDELIEAFVIGAEYFCGICQPKYPPYNNFPQFITLPLANAENGYEEVVKSIVNLGVENLYVNESLASAQLLGYLSEMGFNIVSEQSPDVMTNNWIGTLQLDPGPSLGVAWSGILADSDGGQFPNAIVLVDMNTNLITEGRYRLFEEMLADLETGLVSPELVP